MSTPDTVATTQDPAWICDKYLIRQKLMAISERYAVLGENGEELLFVQRPAHVMRNLLALLAGALIALVSIGLLVAIFTGMGEGPATIAVAIIVGAVGLAATLIVTIRLQPYRHTLICTDRDYRQNVLSVTQDNKVHPILQRFSLRVGGPEGPVLARFSKNVLWNLLRRRWQIMLPDGRTVALAMEDSLLLSILRRTVGQYLPFFRTNFVIIRASDRKLLGMFNRKFSIRDNYALDLSHDRTRELDRRVALAIGILLDTGERR